MIVRQCLGENAVTLEVKQRELKDRSYCAVNGLIGVSEVEGHSEGGKCEL